MFNDKRRIGTLALGLLLAYAGAAARADDWPQWLGPKRDGIWRETGLLEQFPKDGPRVLWREKIGPGYTGPAVAGNRVPLSKMGANDLSASDSPSELVSTAPPGSFSQCVMVIVAHVAHRSLRVCREPLS